MKQCQQCGNGNPEGIQHCRACGARLIHPGERACAKCGIANELDTRYCKGCGNLLLHQVVPQRKPNTDHSQRVLDSHIDQPATSANDPAMPEWVTRFVTPQSTPLEKESPKPEESPSQVMALLRRIFGLSPNEISSIQIRKKTVRQSNCPAMCLITPRSNAQRIFDGINAQGGVTFDSAFFVSIVTSVRDKVSREGLSC